MFYPWPECWDDVRHNLGFLLTSDPVLTLLRGSTSLQQILLRPSVFRLHPTAMWDCDLSITAVTWEMIGEGCHL
jgi:hypothetical protein